MQIQSDYSLKPHNSFGFEVKAKYWAQANAEEDIAEALSFVQKNSLPLVVLGEGSNVVITEDIPGLVLNIAIQGKQVVKESDDSVWLSVGAGENWHQLVLWCLDQQFYGMENLVLIPGAVGAAPIQNIGAYGVELVSCFDSLRAISRDTGEIKDFSKSDCEFGYRDSVFKREFKDRYIISQITLKLSKTAKLSLSYGDIEAELRAMEEIPTPASVAAAVTQIRTRKLPDPSQIGNAGSFFKNPSVSILEFQKLRAKFPDLVGYEKGGQVKLAAGWLVQQCGWKGVRDGDAGVHDRQALVLVNHGKASGREVLSLAEQIRESVKKTFGVDLEIEPRVYS